ncbi:MAG TPA: hypothetical protein PJ982_11240, partial [Lacipirellulaceae bacterium]|nr:hypothetical protein [Lacipirellulaceae bacterium]
LYDTERIPYLPLALTLAWEGEYDEARELLEFGGAAADAGDDRGRGAAGGAGHCSFVASDRR